MLSKGATTLLRGRSCHPCLIAPSKKSTSCWSVHHSPPQERRAAFEPGFVAVLKVIVGNRTKGVSIFIFVSKIKVILEIIRVFT